MPSRAPSQLNRMRRSSIGSQSIQPCSGPYIAATPPCLLLTPRPVSPTSGRSGKATCGETRSATPWQLQMAPEHSSWWQSMKIRPDHILSICLVSEITKQTLPDHHLIFNIQVFFNCSAQISVLKRKTLFNQRGSFVHWDFQGTESLIGCPSFFILVLKIGRNS